MYRGSRNVNKNILFMLVLLFKIYLWRKQHPNIGIIVPVSTDDVIYRM